MRDTLATTTPSAADLRALLARYRVPIYIVAARVRINPIKLGRMIGERISLPTDVADRILTAIEAEARISR